MATSAAAAAAFFYLSIVAPSLAYLLLPSSCRPLGLFSSVYAARVTYIFYLTAAAESESAAKVWRVGKIAGCWRNILSGASAAGCQRAAGAKMNLASYFLIKPSSRRQIATSARMETRGLFFQQKYTRAI